MMGYIMSAVMFLHNMFQLATWGITLYLIESYIRTGSPPCWRDVL